MTSRKISRILFTLVGSIFPIFIGSLHTVAHFKDLLTPEIEYHLQKQIPVLGEQQMMWNTWGVVSTMMGISFIVIGLLNISIIKNTPKTKALPLLPILAMIVYQLAVIYVGKNFDASVQLYGGIFGLIVTFVCLITNHKSKVYDAN